MAIDGTVENLPDTPENEAVFGRHHTDRGHAGTVAERVALGQINNCVQSRAGDLKVVTQTLVAGVHKPPHLRRITAPHLRRITAPHGFSGQPAGCRRQ